MKTISTKTTSGLKQAITLVITASILLITFCFIIWTSQIEKQENVQFYKNKISETKNIVSGLVDVKKMKMKVLAESIANGPMLKSAITTNHPQTINDVLTSIKNKNSLSFVAITKNKNIVYSDNATQQKNESIRHLSKGNFLGATKIGEMIFLIASELSDAELSKWSKITGAKFIIQDSSSNTIIRNFDKNEFINDKQNETTDKNEEVLQFTKDNLFIIGNALALKETLKINFYVSIAQIRKSFERKRNKYLLLGGVLTFIGLIISLVISGIISRMLEKNTGAGNITLEQLYEEIDALKEKIS